MLRLRYGNTNTFFIPGGNGRGGLLLDTDYAGTLPALRREMKRQGISAADIAFVLATHYHPDHAGLIGELQRQGIGHLLVDVQAEHVHFSDHIFRRDGLPFTPIDPGKATVISCAESADFLRRIGISGRILHTPSHSPDSISLLLADGDCFVGDLEPYEYIDAYGENTALQADWDRILSYRPRRVFFAHMPERNL